MEKTQKWYIPLSILTTCSVLLFCFPLKAKAEWYVIGYDSNNNPISMDNESVTINNNNGERTGKVNYFRFGRALFIVNCSTENYYLQSNGAAPEQGSAIPGTVAGVIAEEICDEYSPLY